MVRAPADWRSVLRRAEVLVRRHDMRSLELLFPALRWRDPMARNRAVALLVRMGPLAVPPLLARLEGAETAAERRAAADALGRIGDSRAVARLLRALEDPAMTVRRASIVALLRLEAMNAVPIIARMLEDESGGVRVIAARVLGKFEDPRAVSALVRALGDVQWYVRQTAATALGQIGDRRAIAALEKATRDPQKSVARAAAARTPGAASVTPGESLKRAAGLGRRAGSWSSGYDIALTWRRSPVRIRSSPLPFRGEPAKDICARGIRGDDEASELESDRVPRIHCAGRRVRGPGMPVLPKPAELHVSGRPRWIHSASGLRAPQNLRFRIRRWTSELRKGRHRGLANRLRRCFKARLHVAGSGGDGRTHLSRGHTGSRRIVSRP